jgi:thiol:disulfide interchange protein DsbC
MNTRFSHWMLVAMMASFSMFALAQKPVDEALVKQLKAALEVPGMGLDVRSISASQIEGLYEVVLVNGPILYSNAKGDYFISGELYQVGANGFVNLSEQRQDGERLVKMNAVDMSDMIVFSPKGETKAYINVFTDVTCGYCRKLHQEVPTLNDYGVEVRYLAYPRAGVGSAGYNSLVNAWCADDPADALTRLKTDKSIPTKACDNPISDQYELGQQVGVRGTPAIITSDGKLISGYMPADRLATTLGLK